MENNQDIYYFHISGYSTCSWYQKAKNALLGLEIIFPTKFSIIVHDCPTRDEYISKLPLIHKKINQEQAYTHKSSPIVWISKELNDNDKEINENQILNSNETNQFIGGCDATLAWCRKYLTVDQTSNPSSGISSLVNVDTFDKNHSYQYDLVVIGGGSGGLACSKEAKKFGARVAVLDFVKPSPQGSKWGLGGTCVNVGCIPKKLMHTAALLGDAQEDAKQYGWNASSNTQKQHSWELMVENVQNHIKSLNFGYRVDLREKQVVYLNKLGKFKSEHELECIDAKGKVEVITSARFVIAVGGRPSPLDCIGSEYAITSDDLFSLEKSPGKTLVIGAGYVALECAGFLAGLTSTTNQISVLIRSIALRGFDTDLVSKVTENLEKAHGIQMLYGLTLKSIIKQSDGRLLVTYSDNKTDVFDTVLTAVGRYADTKGLGITGISNSNDSSNSNGNGTGTSSDTVGIQLAINSKNGKLICHNEQTSIPHIYAIGDVIDGAPELTPSAILSGKLLARRLFNNENTYMNYHNIATTVFTPLELGTVGYSEEAAIEKYGSNNIETYLSEFIPLEWTINSSEGSRVDQLCFAKIVTDKTRNNLVIGLHIASPNAGEIIQGFSCAMLKGITYEVSL